MTYNLTISEIHANIARLTDQVGRGDVPRSILDAYVAAARARTDWIDPIPTNVIGIEAVCRECGQTFNPCDVDDTIHLVRVGDDTTPDQDCGGQGDITGWWS